MGSRGDAYENAIAEGLFTTLEVGYPARHRFATQAEARSILFRYIERWYSPHRQHSALAQRSPLALEQAHAVKSIVA